MSIFIGTSGYMFSYWESVPRHNVLNFYKTKDKLKEYSKKLSSVEINVGNYRAITPKMCEGWIKQVDENFRFTIKISLYITHYKKLNNFEEWWQKFQKCLDVLGRKLGALLFQFHPSFKCTDKNIKKLEVVKKIVPSLYKCAFEFRDMSWYEDENIKKFSHLFTKRWCQCMVYVADCRGNEFSFGNLTEGLHIGFINKKIGYVRLHGTKKFSIGTYTQEQMEYVHCLLSQYKYKYAYFNNTDSWTCLPYLNLDGEYDSIISGIENVPSGIYNAEYLQNLFNQD